MLFFRKKNKIDRKFRVPRIWSNRELEKFSELFTGDVVNVSAWQDFDKENRTYSSYFKNAHSYSITNYKEALRGFQGSEGEIFLDLEADLPSYLKRKFDVVYNHTTLEHIYNFKKAFSNICEMSRDVVIVVVPYIQQFHGVSYCDYWRFTPYAMKGLFEENGMELRYCSSNGRDCASIYLFCIGLKTRKYENSIPPRFDLKIDEKEKLFGQNHMNVIGGNVVRNEGCKKL